MSAVDLTFSRALLGQQSREAKAIYDNLLYSLERKYGAPFYQEQYTEKMGYQCNIRGMCLAHAFTEWRIADTQIVFRLRGQFDPKDNRFVEVGGKPEISISYGPLIDGAASKL